MLNEFILFLVCCGHTFYRTLSYQHFNSNTDYYRHEKKDKFCCHIHNQPDSQISLVCHWNFSSDSPVITDKKYKKYLRTPYHKTFKHLLCLRKRISFTVTDICRKADITFLALHGGVGENGQIQATLDMLGIKYTGPNYLGCAIAMNKGVTKSVLKQNRVSVPEGEIFTPADKENGTIDKWNNFPCVVKPCNGGSSVGVSIVEDKKDFDKAMDEAFAWEDEVVVEEYIKGREFSIGLIEGKALPIIEIIPESGFYDYVNKYQAGKTKDVCPAELSEEVTKKMQSEAEKAFKALNLDSYARIDFLLDKDNNTYCLEANSLPGMTPTSLLPQEALVLGTNYEDLCEQIIEVSLKKYK